jgi:hypothetical protein
VEYFARVLGPSQTLICAQGKVKRYVEKEFEGSTRAREIIQLPTVNDP